MSITGSETVFSLQEIAGRLGGRVVGDGRIAVRGVAPVETAGPEEIACVTRPAYGRKAQRTSAAALVAGQPLPGIEKPLILVDDPYFAFARILRLFHPPRRTAGGIDPRAAVAADVEMGEGTFIGPFAVLEPGVRIGDRVQIGAGTFIGAESRIGDDTVIHPNVTIREGGDDRRAGDSAKRRRHRRRRFRVRPPRRQIP